MAFNLAAYEDNLTVVKDFEPALLWHWFSRISATPHPSFHEEALATDIIEWAIAHGLAARRDGIGNVIIKKPATKGYENHEPIALQAHLDMVPQANEGVLHDFATDPIRLRLRPDDHAWLMATGTTLGADNGIGMASCLAVLEDDSLVHPELEVLLTMTEETGMVGVVGLKANELASKIMVNTDTEEIGEVYIGCAGGIDADLSLPLMWQKNPFDATLSLTIKGLRGGHSGLDIDKNRGNAIKLMARVLAKLLGQFDGQFAISHIKGGTLRNAIPREAQVVISCQQSSLSALTDTINDATAQIFDELKQAEPNLIAVIDTTKLGPKDNVLTWASSCQAIHLINALPSGVVRQSDIAKDTVETSLSFGQLKMDDDVLKCVLLIRSLVDSGKEAVCDTLSSIAHLSGAQITFAGDYVGWNPDTDSVITPITTQLYSQILGHEPDIKVIHAGLECGLIKQSHPDMDIVSIGPTIKNAHSPDEMVHIGSVAVYWRLLTEILANAPLKR